MNMKNLLFNILCVGLCISAVSCWDEQIPEIGAARHQVTDLTAIAGDEEALLQWTMPEGWTPTDYLVTYTTDEDHTVSTAGKQEYMVEGLENGKSYVFKVQAKYNDLISNPVEVSAKPSTSRFPVTDLAAQGSDQMVTLTWTRPALTVLSYTLTYYMEGDEANVTEVTIEADATDYTVLDLTNDKNYTFVLVANYAKGASDPATVKGLPTLAIPYALDREFAAVNQPITFTFNTADYPTASDVTWTFPDGTSLTGEQVSKGISSVGIQQVALSATINGRVKTWTLEVTIREYVVKFNEWEQVGTNYEGFKGGCPVFAPDGKTVYNITFNKKAVLYAFDLLTGELKWKHVPASNSASYNPLTVNPKTGDIYYGTTTAGQFYAVTSEGQLKWTFAEAGSMKSSAPAVNADGTVVYIGDASGNIFAIDAASGTKIWSAAMTSAVAGLLVNGNELVAGAGTNVNFYNIGDGTLLSSLVMSASMVGISGFAVAADKNTMYVPVTTGLSSINLSAKSIIVDNFVFAENNPYEPCVAPDGSVFVGCKDNSVYNVKGDLSAVNWTYKHTLSTGKATNAFNFSHPCVDTENHFYITSGEVGNTTYVFNSDGSIKESWTYSEGDNNQKQMGGNNFLDGVLYSAFIGSKSANGLMVGKYVGGERASGWSTHGGDICGSCCIK